MKDITPLSNYLLAFREDSGLPRHFSEATNNFLVPLYKSVQCIWDADIVAEFLDQLLRSSEIMSRHSWKEVVDCLELEATVEEIKPLRTFDVHGRSEHLLWERFVRTKL
jgi:hypothetical protein